MTPREAHTRIAAERERLRALSDDIFDDIKAALRSGASMESCAEIVRIQSRVISAINELSKELREAGAEP